MKRAFKKFGKKMKTKFKKMGKGIKKWSKKVGKGLKKFSRGVARVAKKTWKKIKAGVSKLLKKLGAEFKKFGKKILTKFGQRLFGDVYWFIKNRKTIVSHIKTVTSPKFMKKFKKGEKKEVEALAYIATHCGKILSVSKKAGLALTIVTGGAAAPAVHMIIKAVKVACKIAKIINKARNYKSKPMYKRYLAA